MHLGDFLPDRSGLELWICHEDKPYGVSLVDAATGTIIFHKDGTGDTGRCCADNVWAGNDGAEFWGLGNDVFDGSGNTLSCRRPAINFLSYWDGDLEREILDGYTDSPATISKMGDDGKLTTILSTDGYYTCNTTKGTPCLSADIFGDWREELIVRAADSKSIRIYTTNYDTDYRIQTLMHDPQYRVQVSAQQTAYNQPPHASFYLGSDESLPSYVSVTPLEKGSNPVVIPSKPTAATLTEGAVYMLKNVNSGLYMEVANGAAENGANVQQWGADSASVHNTWRVVSAGDGYYYLYSQLGDKLTYLLDVTAGRADNGTNIEIWSKSSREAAQQFLFSLNDDGSYTIYTKASELESCVEVVNAETGSGANIQQWESNGHACQHWILEQVTDTGTVMDTSQIYQIQNVNSQLYLDVAGGVQADGTNVQQWGSDNPGNHNSWTLEDAGNGYYYITSQLGDGDTWYLTIDEGKSTSGTNASIWSNDGTSAQLFKFVKNPDGTYQILSKASKDRCGLSVADASTGNGGNVLQESVSGSGAQKWNLISVGAISVPETTTEPAATTTAPVTTVKPTDTTVAPTTTVKPVDTTVAPATTVKPADTTAAPETTASSDTVATTSPVTSTGSTDTARPVTTVASMPTTSAISTKPASETTTASGTVDTAATTALTTGTQPQETDVSSTTEPSVMASLIGDINLDHVINMSDVILLSKASVNIVDLTPQQRANGDCYQDGTVDGNDAMTLLRFSVQLIETIPVSPA